MPSHPISRGFLASLLLCSSAFAQTAPPRATAPPPPAAALDQTSPKGTLKLFFAADAHSDGDAIRPLLLAENPAQQHMVTAMADKRNADRLLTEALKAKFPDRWKVDPRQQADAELPAIYVKIDNSDQKINGDTASLKTGSEQAVPVTFKLVKGKWFIPLTTLVQMTDADQLEANAHQIQVQVKVMIAAAADVSGGKYADMDKAIEDVKQRIMTAGIQDHLASTRPAGQAAGPTTRPE